MRLLLPLLASPGVFAQLGHAHETGLADCSARHRRHHEIAAVGSTLRLERRASSTTKASTTKKTTSTTKKTTTTMRRTSTTKSTSSTKAASSSKTTSSSKTSSTSGKTTSPSKSSSLTKTSSTSKVSTTKASSTSKPSSTSSPTKAPSSVSTTSPTLTSSTSTLPPTTIPQTSTTCARLYTASKMITGTGTLPRPTSFVNKTPNSNKLTLDGSYFTIGDPDIFWLCQGQDYGPLGSYTDKAMVREALAMAVALGANTANSRALLGHLDRHRQRHQPVQHNLEQTLNAFDAAAWDIRDYVLYAAREYGLRVILTLADSYAYYTGGKYDFLNWRGVSTANKGAAFYTNAAVIADFENYMKQFLTRVNSYTGVAYKDDPTIIAWETGNELGGYINAEVWPPASWTTAIVATIRKYDTKHLIIDGTNGFWYYTTGATSPGLNVLGIDIVSDHIYPRKTDIISKELPLAKAARKNFLIGEYDWTAQSSTSLATFLNLIESWKPLVGEAMTRHAADSSRTTMDTGIYYPNGNSPADEGNILLLAQHWYRMTNRTPPISLVGVTCPQPVF